MKIVVLGAGPAGLIAALWVQRHLPGAEVTILDKKPIEGIATPEINHAFFVHEDIGTTIGVPLKKVRVSEAVLSAHPIGNWANLYADATIGILTENVMWEIAPTPWRTRTAFMSEMLMAGLLDQLNPNRVQVIGDISLRGVDLDLKLVACETRQDEYDYLINTIPLPIFLKLADWGHSLKLDTAPLATMSWDRREDPAFNKVAQIFYHPEGARGFARFSNIFGNIIWECPRWVDVPTLPLPEKFPAGYARLGNLQAKGANLPLRFIPTDEEEVDGLIFKITRKHKVLQLGRYATWRYKRVDHLPHDATGVIEFIKRERT